MSAPLVSVVMSVYNDARWLPESLGSVLGQTLRELEVVVVDDGSTDATPQVLAEMTRRDPRVRVLRVPHGRPARALNRGLEEARGAFVARLDADDTSHPERLAAQVDLLRLRPQVGIVGSDIEKIDERGEVVARTPRPRDDASIRWKALLWCPFTSSSVVLRRDVLERAGLRFDESLRGSEDYAFFARLLDHAQGANLPRPLVRYRVRESGFSRRNRAEFQDIAVSIAREVLGRWLPDFAIRREEVARLRDAFHGMGRARLPGRPEARELAHRYLTLLDAFRARLAERGEREALADLGRAEAARFVHVLSPGLAPADLRLVARLTRLDPLFPARWVAAGRRRLPGRRPALSAHAPPRT